MLSGLKIYLITPTDKVKERKDWIIDDLNGKVVLNEDWKGFLEPSPFRLCPFYSPFSKLFFVLSP